MQVDYSAAERFLAYVDGERSLADVWNHPAYDVARTHAGLLGRDLDREDVAGAVEGERTAFSNGDRLDLRPEAVTAVVDHVRSNEAAWTDRIEEGLERVTPDEDLSDLTLFLAVGYEFGIGLAGGAYVNANEPLFHRHPREALYVALHECSHVVYDRVHGFSDELGPDDLRSPAGQRRVFETLFHTEAYATYTPLALRRSEGAASGGDHPIREDYGVVSDDDRLRDVVAEYDAFRDRLGDERLSPRALFEPLFGGSRLPYRVGCAMLDGLERRRGVGAVREGFYADPATFLDEYDWLLEEYRGDA